MLKEELTDLRRNTETLNYCSVLLSQAHSLFFFRYKIVFRTCLAVLALCFVACRSQGGTSPGESAPKFSLRSIKGETLSLADFKNKGIVLNFWASWCEPCIAELPSLERLHNILKDKNAQVVSIVIDDSEELVKAEVAKAGVTYPVLLDSNSTVKNLYKVSGVPETFLIKPDGTIASQLNSDGMIKTKITGSQEWDDKDTYNGLLNALLN
jgi:peroxiredoxin